MKVLKFAKGRDMLTAVFSCSVAVLGTVATADSGAASAMAANAVSVDSLSGKMKGGKC